MEPKKNFVVFTKFNQKNNQLDKKKVKTLRSVGPRSSLVKLDFTYIIVSHFDIEFNGAVNVHHATVGVVFGVDFAIEDFVGTYGCNHVGCAAVDGNVVTGAKFVSANYVFDHQKRFLK